MQELEKDCSSNTYQAEEKIKQRAKKGQRERDESERRRERKRHVQIHTSKCMCVLSLSLRLIGGEGVLKKSSWPGNPRQPQGLLRVTAEWDWEARKWEQVMICFSCEMTGLEDEALSHIISLWSKWTPSFTSMNNPLLKGTNSASEYVKVCHCGRLHHSLTLLYSSTCLLCFPASAVCRCHLSSLLWAFYSTALSLQH